MPTVTKQILRQDSGTTSVVYLYSGVENKTYFKIQVRNNICETIFKTSLRMQHPILTQKLDAFELEPVPVSE